MNPISSSAGGRAYSGFGGGITGRSVDGQLYVFDSGQLFSLVFGRQSSLWPHEPEAPRAQAPPRVVPPRQDF
ncbi:hypothetical protein MMC14_003623 [Varicellaria rhodocarpa]|nr:hypothetical protein [Varicellaria rhodocarpa]